MQMANLIGNLLQMTLYACWGNQPVCLTHGSTVSIFMLRQSACVSHTWKYHVHFHVETISLCVSHTDVQCPFSCWDYQPVCLTHGSTVSIFMLRQSACVSHTWKYSVHFHVETISLCVSHMEVQCPFSCWDNQPVCLTHGSTVSIFMLRQSACVSHTWKYSVYFHVETISLCVSHMEVPCPFSCWDYQPVCLTHGSTVSIFMLRLSTCVSHTWKYHVHFHVETISLCVSHMKVQCPFSCWDYQPVCLTHGSTMSIFMLRQSACVSHTWKYSVHFEVEPTLSAGLSGFLYTTHS